MREALLRHFFCRLAWRQCFHTFAGARGGCRSTSSIDGVHRKISLYAPAVEDEAVLEEVELALSAKAIIFSGYARMALFDMGHLHTVQKR